MKTSTSFVLAGLCSLIVSTAFAEPAAPDAPTPPALAESQAREEAVKAHIKPPKDILTVATPPPAPRAEVKRAAPAAGYVWMPGHWKPVEGKWLWVTGEWGIPATPSSVWIESRYDSKTKGWSAGYWQPDRPESYEPDAAPASPPKPEKF